MNESKEVFEIVEYLKRDPIKLFDNKQFERLTESEKKLSLKLTNSPTKQLNILVTKSIGVINASDPESIGKKQSFFARWTGKTLEEQIGFVNAANQLEGNLNEAIKICDSLRELVSELKVLEDATIQDNVKLGNIVDACDELYRQGFKYDDQSQQERFERRRANLRVLLNSNVMSVEGFKLQRNNIVDMIDKFEDVKTITLPIWKQHAIHYELNQNFTPDIGEKIKAAHHQVSTELSQIKILLN